MTDYINNKFKIKKFITHQNIGGEEIYIEREIPINEVYLNATSGNIACLNFIKRRNDFSPNFDKKLFYGHVLSTNLGYVVCDDELEEKK